MSKKVKKTTASQFREFKRGFSELQERLGLTQYDVRFELKILKDNFAEIAVHQTGKIAIALLNAEVSVEDIPHFQPYQLGQHEAIHLLMSRLTWLGGARHIDHGDIQEEEEAVVIRIEKGLL